MSKFSQLLLYLLRLSISKLSTPVPYPGELKEAYINRFMQDLISTIRYQDTDLRYLKAKNNWYKSKFIERKETTQTKGEDTQTSL